MHFLRSILEKSRKGVLTPPDSNPCIPGLLTLYCGEGLFVWSLGAKSEPGQRDLGPVHRCSNVDSTESIGPNASSVARANTEVASICPGERRGIGEAESISNLRD